MASQQGQTPSDQTASFFWYIVLLTTAVILAWIFGKKYLVPPLFFVRSCEIYILEIVLKGWNMLAHYTGLTEVNLKPYQHIYNFMMMVDPQKVTADHVSYISEKIGNAYRYPFAVILLVLAYIAFFKHRSARFAATYSMKALRNSESENWPYIVPVLSQDIVKEKLDQGPWAMSQLPLDFCKTHHLLKIVVRNGKNCWSIVPGSAERVFVLQMGSLWNGVDRLPMHVKALLVIFVSRINREKKLSLNFLAQISRSAASGPLNFTGIDALAKKYEKHKAVQWVVHRHAYVYTVMATLLDMARLEGVLASAEFVWLKPVDRRMWYVLSNVGRTTCFVEVAGVYAHWLAEKKLGRALYTPVVHEAVQALDLAVGEILYASAGETWHTSKEG